MSFLTLANVNKSYGATRAVADMNLSVDKGEFVSLLGPSGCGKTTTLQMIAGFCEVTSGQVTLDGRDITHGLVGRAVFAPEGVFSRAAGA